MNFQGSFYKSYHHGAHIFNGLLFQNSKKLGRYDVDFKRVDVDSITLCCHTNADFHFFKVCKLDAVGSSGILKMKQKLGVTFNFDTQDVIDLTKISKMTMCRASEANS